MYLITENIKKSLYQSQNTVGKKSTCFPPKSLKFRLNKPQIQQKNVYLTVKTSF
jgi:hypothetical protein